MTKPLKEFRKQIKPQVQAAARAKAASIIAEMRLAESRKVKEKSQ